MPTTRRQLLISGCAPWARHSLPLRPTGLAAGGLALLGLAGCGGLPMGNALVVPEATLRRSLLRSFPVRQQVLGLIDLTFGEPVLRLLPADNRVALAVDAQGRDRLLGQTLGAELGFDARLRWQPSDSSLRLSEVRVDRLRLLRATGAAAVDTQRAGRPAMQPWEAANGRSSLERMARYVAEEALEGLLVHRLSGAQLTQLQERGLKVDSVAVVPTGLRIQLAPMG